MLTHVQNQRKPFDGPSRHKDEWDRKNAILYKEVLNIMETKVNDMVICTKIEKQVKKCGSALIRD